MMLMRCLDEMEMLISGGISAMKKYMKVACYQAWKAYQKGGPGQLLDGKLVC